MKKLITLLFAVVLATTVFAEESVLIKSDVSANLEEYDFASNFEITSDSGWFTKDKLVIYSLMKRDLDLWQRVCQNTSQVIIKLFPLIQYF